MRHQILFSALILVLTACHSVNAGVALAPTDYARVPGWSSDKHDQALKSFFHSCETMVLKPGQKLKVAGKSIRSETWQTLCHEALGLRNTPWAAKGFFEKYFIPYQLVERGEVDGKLTGYYAPLLRGSLHRGGRYQYAVYAAPPELKGGVPFLTRKEIDQGALAGRGLELMYLDDPVMLYFLQVQGTGLVEMNDGSMMRLSYADNNNYAYYAIGKELIRRGALESHEVSLNAIRAWMYAHPSEAIEVMQANPRYIFFKLDRHGEAFGAQGVPLTPERSLAVDPAYIPYGLPIFVSTTLGLDGTPYERLMIAQDTGSAIKGAIRGDIYFGIGHEAEKRAGPMNNAGQFTLLIPRD
ncbi:MAG: MltA domain-containing protein [Rickettsiales bacterium]